MTPKELIESTLAPLKPVLDSAGRAIEIVEINDEKAHFKLVGFCGGCGCASSYADGLRELVASKCPTIKEVVIE